MPSAAEVESFLAPIDPAVITAARTLVEKGRVRLEGHTHGSIEGRVKMEEDTVRVALTRKGLLWEADSDAEEEEVHHLAAAALIMEAEGQPEMESAVTVPEKSLNEIVEEKLSRQLTPSEEQYLAKVEKRFERFRALGEIHDHDLVRLNSRWPIQSYDPLKLWPEPPKDVLEFWNYLAAALLERKLTYPAFLENVTDLIGTRSRLSAWREQEDLHRRAELIREFSQREAPLPVQRELRLLVTPSEARIQVRDPEAE
ncbi:MAG: hypothetical protein ACAI34_18335, partial [Verrucomicrobium sp.]